ncbi:flagellar hook-length control protein FliK [Treponema sp.]|uniref:flagellar hook-length control protein FliK n=1 Tax=Treponema sp. TaxID=166 RepID=UPI0025FCE81A|nr:flagellar hook-length control protein FliK [Treponema sp.]MCR5217501.1 flagellar hook-length control protein FliK [Treponema sp.]
MQNLAIISVPKEKADILSVKTPASNSLQKKDSSSDFSTMLSEMTAAREKPEVKESQPEKESSYSKVSEDKKSVEKEEIAEKNIPEDKKLQDKKEDLPEEKLSEKNQDKNDDLAINQEPNLIFAGMNSFEEKLPSQSLQADVNESEKLELSGAQLDYLHGSSKEENFDFLIDNAEEYIAGDKGEFLLNKAQDLSLESPDKFLVMAEQVSENISAAEITEESLMPFSVKEQKLQKEGEAPFFTEDLKNAQQKKEGVFTIFDNRSPDEKVSAIEENTQLKVEISEKESSSLDMTLNLNQQHVNQNLTSSVSQTAAADGSTFQQMLSQTISHNAPEFVKAGNIVLRDNNNGSINMILKPESLGNVKVSLQLSDKVITGQIVVATKEAFEAFKENLDTLRQAFQQSGFEDAQFNLTFSDNSQSGAFAGQQNPQQQNSQFYSNKAYSGFVQVEKDLPADETRYYSSGQSKIDVVA